MEEILLFGGLVIASGFVFWAIQQGYRKRIFPGVLSAILCALTLLFATACAGLSSFSAAYFRSSTARELAFPLLLTQLVAALLWAFAFVDLMKAMRDPQTSGALTIASGIALTLAGLAVLAHGLCGVASG
jgi:hypothetical protein